MKRKKLIWKLIPWMLVIAALAALVVFVFIPLYSIQDKGQMHPPLVSFYEGGNDPVVMENDQLLFELDPSSTHFTVTEKATGRIWNSNPKDASNDSIAKAANKEILDSTLIVTYTVPGGEVGLNNYAYSIVNQSYDIKKLEDGSVRIDYVVGKIEKNYIIPVAITQERYEAFIEKLSKNDKRKVSKYYMLYTPEKLDKAKNKDELVENYPEILNQPLYILASDVSETNKKKVEALFADVGYTQNDYDEDMLLVANSTRKSKAVFNVPMIYSLEGNDLVVRIPYEELKYQNEYPLTYLSVLPMFGAAGQDQDGFILIPEGGGAIIHYNNQNLSQSSYYANLYGWDYGTERREAISETKDAFPVFGMTRDGGSFICIMEGASSYSGVAADIAGRYNSYNYAYGKYNVLHFDRYNVSQKTADLIYVYEDELPLDTIVQRYRFVNSDKYTDMASAYGDYLLEHYPHLQEKTVTDDLPVVVEMIGAIDKKVVKFGMPVKSIVPTTTFSQAEEIISDLKKGGIDNLSVVMAGWSNGGMNQRVLTSVHVLSELGGESGMKKLIKKAKEDQVDLYFDGINCFAYDSGLLNGFLSFRDAARYTTREEVKLYPYDNVTYQLQKDHDPYYLVKPSYAKQNASNLIKALKERDVQGVAFRDIGNLLSADYYKKDIVTREKVKDMNVQTLQEAQAAGLKTLIKEGNDYAIPYSDLIINMNLTGNAYSIIDETIPFYQIAIHGICNYTGDSINLSGDYRDSMLKAIEYGAGLYFCLIKEDTRVLMESDYTNLCSTGYDLWKEDILSMASRYQKEMKGLNKERIVNHEHISEFVTATTYGNGTKVYVNYDTEDFSKGNLTVPARDYYVEKGGIKE